MDKKAQIETIDETQLIKDPLIVRIVKILNITSLSILELLEYNLSLKDINYSMANRVIQYDKPTTTREEMSALGIPLGGDYYYNLLKGNVKIDRTWSSLTGFPEEPLE